MPGLPLLRTGQARLLLSRQPGHDQHLKESRGVTFEICEITLKNRGLTSDQFIQEADFTPSGVVRIAKLQAQGYAYIKP